MLSFKCLDPGRVFPRGGGQLAMRSGGSRATALNFRDLCLLVSVSLAAGDELATGCTTKHSGVARPGGRSSRR